MPSLNSQFKNGRSPPGQYIQGSSATSQAGKEKRGGGVEDCLVFVYNQHTVAALNKKVAVLEKTQALLEKMGICLSFCAESHVVIWTRRKKLEIKD